MKRKKKIYITKASGDVVEFSEEKIRESLKRTGADEDLTNAVVASILPKLYNGITTKKIYQLANSLLKTKDRPIAARYHLKQGIMELGPSGYPFEHYIGELLKNEGYYVKNSEIVKGKCISHEVDIVAMKDNDHFMIECKYHNQRGNVSDVKVPLYIQSRFKDVEATWIKIHGHSSKFHQGWVVTNTRFTLDAEQYGNCSGLKLISWNYPGKESLRSRIDKAGLYPVTCLTTLSQKEKNALLEKKVVLCLELCRNKNHLKSIGIKPQKIQKVISESLMLCQNKIRHDKH